MANIPVSVSIDAQGNITCPDITARRGDTITWSATGGSVSNIVPGDPSPFTMNPTSTRGQWSATVLGAGSYTIWDPQGKQRTPKITIVSPIAEKA